MRHAKLLGFEHHEIESVAAIAEGPAAIALSRGGARKTYSYTDPNEDAVGFAIGPAGVVAAVADGHHGARGAECAIEWVLTHLAEPWTATHAPCADETGWSQAAGDALQRVHRAVIEQGESMGIAPAPTTLSLALVRPDQDRIVHASVGDSHAFRVAREDDALSARDLGWATTGERSCPFLGYSYDGGVLRDSQWVVGCEAITGATALVLASDGLSERYIGVEDPAAAVTAAVAHGTDHDPQLRALETCRQVTELALAAHRENRSGDNMSAAVVWLEDLGFG